VPLAPLLQPILYRGPQHTDRSHSSPEIYGEASQILGRQDPHRCETEREVWANIWFPDEMSDCSTGQGFQKLPGKRR
jgi:hypothetical protein